MSKASLHNTVIVATFGLFMAEAILHYNMGANKDETYKRFVFPPTKDLIRLGVVVGLFSVLNGILITHLQNN